MAAKKLCLIHANCQGEPLADFLRRVPGFCETHEIRLYTNYIYERIDPADLQRCAVFLYQYLPEGEKWGELASDALLARLPRAARTLAIPSMFFRGYWPFWQGGVEFSFSDEVLERLLAAKLPKQEILRIYLRGNVIPGAEVEERTMRSLAHERTKEARTPIKYVDLILRHFREEMLFSQVNHPGARLLSHVGREVLRLLEVSEPAQGVEALMGGLYPEFRMPVHPRVAEYWGLSFADEETEYPVFGRSKTFARYAEDYLDARLLGIDDFLSYLRLR
ncbi:MAG: WcbI family polysaccharide biosynthesis putative acetyltransferase [Desulfovibrio sp.]